MPVPNPATSSPEVMLALKRRGMDVNSSQLNQVSPDARPTNPVQPPVNPSQAPTSPQVPQATKQEYSPQSQDDLIIMSLIEQLSRNNKLEKEKMNMSQISPNVPNLAGSQTSNYPKEQQSNYPF